MRNWRFYDQFRTDRDTPSRQPQLGTRTPILAHDGHDVAAAIQTIREIGDVQALDAAIKALEGSSDPALQSLLRKLRRPGGPSANIHWSPENGRLLVIDMM